MLHQVTWAQPNHVLLVVSVIHKRENAHDIKGLRFSTDYEFQVHATINKLLGLFESWAICNALSIIGM